LRLIGLVSNVQTKAARAAAEPTNRHNACGARSLFGRKLGIFSSTFYFKGHQALFPTNG